MVYYSGLGLSELYLNGAKVDDHVLSPGLTDYDKHVLYVTSDVTGQLASGRNAIGMVLGNGRYYAPRAQPNPTQFSAIPGPCSSSISNTRTAPRSSVVSDESLEAQHRRPHPRQQRI